jgi:hypothetical protein
MEIKFPHEMVPELPDRNEIISIRLRELFFCYSLVMCAFDGNKLNVYYHININDERQPTKEERLNIFTKSVIDCFESEGKLEIVDLTMIFQKRKYQQIVTRDELFTNWNNRIEFLKSKVKSA